MGYEETVADPARTGQRQLALLLRLLDGQEIDLAIGAHATIGRGDPDESAGIGQVDAFGEVATNE